MGNAASTRIRANNKWEGAPTVEYPCWQKLTNDLNYYTLMDPNPLNQITQQIDSLNDEKQLLETVHLISQN